ncbi:hypothetical protein BJX99DRAFT_216760 [Aspergillus californicus]
MFSHSTSSSPDILAPPGDVDYLISSPFKPFLGRQSSLMSPANVRILNTPGGGKRKRSRISLSPAKSAHSIRFDDIVLPSSPAKKLTGQQRSASPNKDQGGNVSPWRIQLTLEATQDEENQASPSRKRSKQSTITTKIPLKDDSEQTPKRPRGRPRKSTPGPLGNSEQKRRPGRPRKSQPESDAIKGDGQVEAQVEIQAANPAPTVTGLEGRNWSPINLAGDADSDDGFDGLGMDIPFEVPDQMELPGPDQTSRPAFETSYDTPNGDAIDRFPFQQGDHALHSTPSKMPSPTRESEARSRKNSVHAGHTPMPPRTRELKPSSRANSTDADHTPMSPPTRYHKSRSPENSIHAGHTPMPPRTRELKSSSRTNSIDADHTPIPPSTRYHKSRSPEESVQADHTPVPPNQGPHSLSSENSIHAGHTPMPPRTYPVSSLSSPVHDEQQERNSTRGSSVSASKSIRSRDPTSEHREFDSIVESEGFSMVSLDTLPSARQTGLISNHKLSKGSLKPFIERETNGVIKRKAQVPVEQDFASNQSLDPAKHHVEFPQPRPSSRSSTAKRPLSSPTFPTKSPPTPKRKSLLQLVKLVRTGIALGRVLSRSEPPLGSGMAVPDYMEPRQRLEMTFSDLDTDSQRLLRAALGLGQVLAIRRKMAEIRSPERRAMLQQEEDWEEEEQNLDTPKNHRDVSRTPNGQYDGAIDSSPSTEMKRRFAEWQREREAISRAIEEANSSQVIVVDSDSSDAPGSERSDDADDVDQSLWLRQAEEEQAEGEQPQGVEEMEEEQEQELGEDDKGEDYGIDIEEDDGYEDIWQEQAQDEGNSDQEPMLEPQNDVQSSPWKGGSTPADRWYGTTYSPAYWVDGQSKVPNLGQSRVRDLREEEVDVTALLRAEDTPNRARYYHGKSSPVGTAQEISPQRVPSSTTSQRQIVGQRGLGAAERQVASKGTIDERYDTEHDHLAKTNHHHWQSSPPNNVRYPQLPSSVASQRLRDTEPYNTELDEPEEPEDYIDFSPERDLEDGTFLIDPTTRHESEMHRQHTQFADNPSVSDGADEDEEASVHEETLTPRNAPTEKDVPASSWFQRITSLTPGWLKAPNRNPSSLHGTPSQPRSRSASMATSLSDKPEDKEPLDRQDQEDDVRESEPPPPIVEADLDIQKSALPDPQVASTRARTSTTPKPKPKPEVTPSQEAKPKARSKAPATASQLSTSGYFTDANYALLRRLYRFAKQSPESFPYNPNPTHADIIGDYIWTSDNIYGVPITELQFAIVHWFRKELAAGDLRSGGSGRVRWTDAELHRRLVSVIIGEQVRADRKEELAARPTRARPRSIIQR